MAWRDESPLVQRPPAGEAGVPPQVGTDAQRPRGSGGSERPLPVDDLERILGWCHEDWADLRGARILLTGGTGFVGTWLLAALLHADQRLGLGLRVVVTSRNPQRFRNRHPELAEAPAVAWVAADVRRPLPVSGPFTHVVHAATETDALWNRDHPRELLECIVDGTRNVLDVAAAGGVRRFLYVSSGAVYGPQPVAVSHLDEVGLSGPDPLDAGAVYHEGKRMAETWCAERWRAGALSHLVVARLFAFVGPLLPLDAHFAAGNFIGDALAGRPIRVAGDGSAVRSYLYAADMAAWLVRALVRGPSGQALNIGSDVAVTIRELAEVVARSGAPAVPVEIEGRLGRAGGRYVPSIQRASDQLGVRVWTPLDEAVALTMAWHRGAHE